ncbi:MAG TPA: hypothetical protein VNQ97_01935, partial [Burkholderiaceae bacterium]|nr:hypothetical protein [Burkholderiaceae bacterium]
GALLPFTSIGSYFEFVPLPAAYYVLLGAMVVIYLGVVQLVKQRFYRWSATTNKRPLIQRHT